jgi:hypothetical protein
MDTAREQLNRPVVLGLVAFVIGLLIGWMLLGWVLFPVEWTDATPAHLRADLQEDYLRMAIDSYAVNRNVALAQARYLALGEYGPEVLSAIQVNPGTQSADSIAAFTSAIGGTAVGPQVTSFPVPPPGAGCATPRLR